MVQGRQVEIPPESHQESGILEPLIVGIYWIHGQPRSPGEIGRTHQSLSDRPEGTDKQELRLRHHRSRQNIRRDDRSAVLCDHSSDPIIRLSRMASEDNLRSVHLLLPDPFLLFLLLYQSTRNRPNLNRYQVQGVSYFFSPKNINIFAKFLLTTLYILNILLLVVTDPCLCVFQNKMKNSQAPPLGDRRSAAKQLLRLFLSYKQNPLLNSRQNNNFRPGCFSSDALS